MSLPFLPPYNEIINIFWNQNMLDFSFLFQFRTLKQRVFEKLSKDFWIEFVSLYVLHLAMVLIKELWRWLKS